MRLDRFQLTVKVVSLLPVHGTVNPAQFRFVQYGQHIVQSPSRSYQLFVILFAEHALL